MQEILAKLKTKNEVLNNLELLAEKPTLSSIPSHLEIEFTNACNLRCYMCYQSSQRIDYSQIEDNSVDSIVAMLPYVKTILIAGLGEQLLYQRLGDFLEQAAYYLCKVDMYTNGQLAHNYLDIFRYVSLLTVSFDGATKDTFQAQRYGANFKSVLRNIQLIRKVYPEIRIRLGCVVSKINVHQIEDIVKIGCEMGVNILSFPHVQHAPTIELTSTDYPILKNQLNNALRFASACSVVIEYNDIEYLKDKNNKAELSADDLLAYVNKESKDRKFQQPKDVDGLKRIVSSREEHKMPRPLSKGELLKLDEELGDKIARAEQLIRERPVRSIRKPHCLSPWNYAFIRMNGKFRLCPYFELEAGNANEGLSSKGFNDEALVEIRLGLLKWDRMLPACKTCPDQHHRKYKYSLFQNLCAKYEIVIEQGVNE